MSFTHETKIIRRLETSPFKSIYFQISCKNYCSNTIEATMMEKYQMKANWFLFFSYDSHLNTKANLNAFFSVTLTLALKRIVIF